MRPLRVLYLEDNPNDRDLTMTQLDRAAPGEFVVTPVETLMGANAYLHARVYDLVLADLNVTDSKGVATIKGLLAGGCKIPIIAFTGDLNPERGLEAVAAGASDFVGKGITDATTLANRIRFTARRGPAAGTAQVLEGLVLERTGALTASLSEVRATNARIAEQKHLMDVFMDGVPSCCFLYDLQTNKAVFASRAYEAMYGQPVASLQNNAMGWVDAVHPDDVGRLMAMMNPRTLAVAASAPEPIEYRVLRNGAIQWLRATWTPIFDRDGKLTHAAGITEDVTGEHLLDELREAGRQKDQAIVMERANSKFKSQFLNMAAHDLATPITPLRLQVATLRMRAKTAAPDMVNGIELLDRNLVRLSGLITDLLDVARIESGKVRLRLQPCELTALVHDGLETIQRLAEQGSIKLDPGLRLLTATTDAERFAQITLNLLSNAIKFTPRGGHVRIRLFPQDGKAVLEVQDDGRGISAEDLAKLFQPFTRVGDTAAVTGTGLGLYISRGMARALGGDLTASSPGEGKGTTFTLTLPLQPPVVQVPQAMVAA